MSSRKLLRRFSSSISDLLSIPRKDYCEQNDEFTPLHNAVRTGNTVMAKNFIDSKSVWIDEPDHRGQTALHLSITFGNTDMTAILLKGGANVDCADFEGSSPCHLACRDGMIDHFNLLLYYHADICSVDRVGRTPFDLACEFGQEKMVDCMFNCGLQKSIFQTSDLTHSASALHLAAGNGHIQIVSFLLENGWNLNSATETGSALHLAAGNGRIQVVRYLLRAGIDTTITNCDGQTAYEWAKKNSCRNPITYKEIRFLLKNFNTFTNGVAIDNYCGVKADELSLSIGDKVWIIERKELWKGIVFGRKGNSRSGFFRPKVICEDVAMSSNRKLSSFGKPLPAVPKRSCSNIQYHDINRNSPTQMASFGRTSSCYSDSGHRPNNLMTKSTSGTSFGIGESFFNSRTPSQMYSSSSCLYPNRNDGNFTSNGSNSSHSSSGFESVKCSTSTSASSFPSAIQSNESGCESAQSVHSVESGSGSSSSIHGQEVDVTMMVLNGVPHAEIIANWLDSINMNEYLAVFLKQGYDLLTIARCTPADLQTLGIKNPEHRKKLISDIHSWKINDNWPAAVPNNSLREWLHAIALAEYLSLFESQNYFGVSDILNLNWEDFEDIGVKRLGHLKRFGLAIKKLKDHKRNQPQIQQYSSTHSLYSAPVYHRMSDPPPPAPIERKTPQMTTGKIDYFSYQNKGRTITKPTSKPAKDPIFVKDEPIRLNLTQTGKILSDISKLKKGVEEEEDDELDDTNECPPPPAPLYCNKMTSNFNRDQLSLSNEQFPFANENCGTIRYSSTRANSSFEAPASLPPLIADDHASDHSSVSSSTKPTIDEMLQDIQGAMDNLINT